VLENAAHGAALCNHTDLNGSSPYLYTRWSIYLSLLYFYFYFYLYFYFYFLLDKIFVKSISFIHLFYLSGNPTNDIAEQAITALEGGHSTFVTASGISPFPPAPPHPPLIKLYYFIIGMASVSTILLSFLKAGDHLIVPECVYGIFLNTHEESFIY
jgi:hypothetical protein